MFRTPIRLLSPFTNELHKITTKFEEIQSDSTLFMTATALLYNRVENLKLESTITRLSTQDTFDHIPFNTNPAVYSFHWVETSQCPDERLDLIKDRFKKIDSFPAVEKYVKEKFGQEIYVRIFSEENAVGIFMDRISVEMWHLMQSFISRYFTIFKEKPLTPDEVSFLQTLILKTGNAYMDKIQELGDKEDFMTFALGNQLASFEKTLYEKKIKAAENEISTYETKISSLLTQYREAVTSQLDAKIRLEGLRSTCDATSERTELQDYLIGNRNLTRISVNGSVITFVVKTYLIPYLVDSWENMSRRGAIFDGFSGEFADKQNAKLFLDAIFSSKRCLKLRMCAEIELDYLGGNVRSSTSYDYSTLKDYLPNPHLQRHNCFGQNGPDILAQLKMGDPIGAIECAINCVKHVNIDELTATFKPMLRTLTSFQGKCIVTDDEQELTPVQALRYLKEKQNENNSAGQSDETETD